jgi:outer membrane protein assembly factor BamB
LRAAPIKAGEYVVVATESGRVVATSNAQQQWSWPSGVPEAEIYTTPVFSEGMIYVILVDGQLVKIDAESGGQRWVFKPEAEE